MIAPAIKKPQSDWAKQVKICVSHAAKHIKPIIEYIVMSYKMGVLAALFTTHQQRIASELQP